MSNNTYSPTGGVIVGADNVGYNIVDLLGGGTPVNNIQYDISQFAPRGGLVIGNDGRAYDLVQLLKNGGMKATDTLPSDGEEMRVYATPDGIFLFTGGEYVQLSGQEADVYGVYWDGGSSGTLTRLGKAAGLTAAAQVGTTKVHNDFDLISPWADMFLCNLDNDGNIVARYGEPRFAFDGVVAPYAYKLPVMVAIPKFYYKVNYRYPGREIYISPRPVSGFKLHEAFVDGATGDEMTADYIFIGSEIAGVESVGGKEMLTANSGENMYIGTRAGFRTRARNRGEGWNQIDLAAWSALQMLYLVEFAQLNSQTALGSGISSMPYSASYAATVATTNANTITLTTANANQFDVGLVANIGTAEGNQSVAKWRRIETIKDNGDGSSTITLDGDPFSVAVGNVLWCGTQPGGLCDELGEKSGRQAGDNAARCQVSYRGVKGIHGNTFNTLDGVNIFDHVWYYARNPADWNDSSITEDAGYINIGSCPTTNGYLKNFGFSMTAPWCFMPGEIGGGTSTYACDYYYQNTGARVPRVGGSATHGAGGGVWCVYAIYTAGTAGWYFGGRLLYKKPN